MSSATNSWLSARNVATTIHKKQRTATITGRIDNVVKSHPCRGYLSAAATAKAQNLNHANQSKQSTRPPLGEQAKQLQADKEFFVDILSSAATKRDAKAYIGRLKQPTVVQPKQIPRAQPYVPKVNTGNLFRSSRAADESPRFSQQPHAELKVQEVEQIHVAVVKLSSPAELRKHILAGISGTFAQLHRLSISPCIVIEPSTSAETRADISAEVEEVVLSIQAQSESLVRKLDSIFTTNNAGQVWTASRELLLRPLKKGQIPVISPIAYNEDKQRLETIEADAAVLALAREFVGLHGRQTGGSDGVSIAVSQSRALDEVALDRLIVIDKHGGIPRNDGSGIKHVFLNLEQEYKSVKSALHMTQIHDRRMANLDLLRQALDILPPSSSGLMATYEEAANIMPAVETSPSSVGTRRSKNALIHNLLTDKPVQSASLPQSRLSANKLSMSRTSSPTFIKRGMPLTILPDPGTKGWTHSSPRVNLTDPQIDLARLVYLINDSFGRKLDTSAYLQRVKDKVAGVIIAGNYEGGAILTWETPENLSTDAQPVPYLDKFAVLRRSQGAGGVADVLFNAMVHTCFPNGVCWRSRKDNPVNKWYFERSRGTWKLPGSESSGGKGWTMFWTTPEVEVGSSTFSHYEAVCRGVLPTWKDNKKIED